MYKKNTYWFVIKNKSKKEELFKFDAGTEVRKKIMEFMYESQDQNNELRMSYVDIAKEIGCHRESVMKAVKWAQIKNILIKTMAKQNKVEERINKYTFIL